ncbi:hypothetical protein SDRG_02398 [Saprolegnia diclina VS20]|uniref:GAF domain-containing protein n=1 Tax=Saprolegnia diclina (strain VS20) TaxID=1156394 RepID=T0SCH9_SAPDV|nr:hypothetical protein SDRG_02398 [Saprolegnia diclina VS20]EQC40507.1 hypothetical protein SDRG_02398 [Saprolegnia diclina VS20]|eukprot:XP_008606206.1 hypothetical protein SDRG_02398 [Saprolegnia diclina VS20]
MPNAGLLVEHTERLRALGTASSVNETRVDVSLDDVLSAVLKSLVAVVPSQSASVFIYDKRSRMLQLAAVHNVKRPLNGTFSTAMGLVGRCFSRKATINICRPDAVSTSLLLDPLYDAKVDGKMHASAENMLCLPLQREIHRAIGVVQMVNRITPKSAHGTAVLLEERSSSDLGVTTPNMYRASEVESLGTLLQLIAPTIDAAWHAKLATESTTQQHQDSAMDLLNLLNSKLTGEKVDFSTKLRTIEDDPVTLDEPIKMPEPPRPSPTRKSMRNRIRQSILRIPRPPVYTIRQVKAATRIQAGCRGWQIRRLHYLAVLRQERDAAALFRSDMAIVLQAVARRFLARLYAVALRRAYDLMARAMWQYLVRLRERSDSTKRTVSPKIKYTWVRAASKLAQLRTRAPSPDRLSSIQKIMKKHKRHDHALANPSRMHAVFSKLQARYRGFAVRQKVQHAQSSQRDVATPAIVRLRANNNSDHRPVYKYPSSTHVGRLQYVSLHRSQGRASALQQFFDTARGQMASPRRPLQNQDDLAVTTAASLASRRLITAIDRPATTPSPVPSKPLLPPMSSGRSTSSRRPVPRPKPRYHLDMRHVYALRDKQIIVTVPTAIYDRNDERCYPTYRKTAFEDALGVAPSRRPHVGRVLREPQPPLFASLVSNPKHHRDEATRRALHELQTRQQARKDVQQQRQSPTKLYDALRIGQDDDANQCETRDDLHEVAAVCRRLSMQHSVKLHLGALRQRAGTERHIAFAPSAIL